MAIGTSAAEPILGPAYPSGRSNGGVVKLRGGAGRCTRTRTASSARVPIACSYVGHDASETKEGPKSVLVVGADGVEYQITLQPAPKVGLWMSGPWRWWSTITRDTSWWLTVGSSAVGWPVLRERYRAEDEASRRSGELSRAIRAGEWLPPKLPPLLRRQG
jgi:hypothetical protein